MEETKKQGICCICMEEDNFYAFIHCNFCKEGMICCECECEYSSEYFEHILCPICRNIYIDDYKKGVIIYGLLYYYDNIHLYTNNKLITRWINNYIDTELFTIYNK
jgi:hypothetical protein